MIFWTELTQKGYLQSKTKKWKSLSNIWISLSTNFHLKLAVLIFFCILHIRFFSKKSVKGFLKKVSSHKQKEVFKKGISSQKWKSEHHHWILIIELVQVPNFSLNWRFWFFGPYLPKFARKGHSQPKIWKVNTTTEFCILELVQTKDFSLNQQFWFLGPNFLKMGIFGIFEYHHWTLHIPIN